MDAIVAGKVEEQAKGLVFKSLGKSNLNYKIANDGFRLPIGTYNAIRIIDMQDNEMLYRNDSFDMNDIGKLLCHRANNLSPNKYWIDFSVVSVQSNFVQLHVELSGYTGSEYTLATFLKSFEIGTLKIVE